MGHSRAMNYARLAMALQVLATALMGLMAGFFFAFSVDIIPAMLGFNARDYIATQQAINRAVRNLPFAMAYFGAAALPLAAAGALWLAGEAKASRLWLAIGTAYVLGVFVLTREINIPINTALALWDPLAPPANWAAARDEWNQANLWRCLAACGSFGAALLALAIRPRPTGPQNIAPGGATS
jgi:uncharacterized membrane protein